MMWGEEKQAKDPQFLLLQVLQISKLRQEPEVSLSEML